MLQTITGHETHEHGISYYSTYFDVKQRIYTRMNNKEKAENGSVLLSPGRHSFSEACSCT